ncbi:hypothetical protein [Methanobrevibacter sp.]|uniref:hypothetical protein n=1 Tax=Methanobrevibacter sp. TaxID=66852 RepID=UPI0025F6C5E4|nr:hypothetical protein [Methanobrevibacter sp.]MBR4447260.1 hypothetical protein [Methanobrevibacter sp.]
MYQKETFFKDMENCKIPFTHIEENITDPSLKAIDKLYGAADVMSMENAKKHYFNLKLLAFFGTALAVLFLLYDEAELHLFIFLCIIILAIFGYSDKFGVQYENHKKYLEYRVLAETLRVHYFLSIAGIKEHITIILPWFIKKNSPWINEILLSLPVHTTTEKRSILNCWIRDQLEYHQKAWIESNEKKQRNDKSTRRALYITVATFLIAGAFEFYMLFNASGEIHINELGMILKTLQDSGIMVGFEQVDMIRSLLKIIVGSMSAFTLFLGSYYGKMSLSNEINDHRRMVMLYEKAENEVLQKGESEDLIMSLAHEFLIENTLWFAYQSNNTPELILE